MTTRGAIRRESLLVVALMRLQRGACFHCGKPMIRGCLASDHRADEWTREHLIAKPHNDGHRSIAFVLAHRGCNRHRGDAPLSAETLARGLAIWALLPKWMRRDCENGSVARATP